MSKGLEALERLSRVADDSGYAFSKQSQNDYQTIEQDLKTLESLEKKCNEQGLTLQQYLDYFAKETINNEKKLIALEIIKNKKVAYLLIWLMKEENKETAFRLYNEPCDEDRKLTQEEWNILKEVLL